MIWTMKFHSKPLLSLCLFIGLVALLGTAKAAKADAAAQCRMQGGTYLTGIIEHGPFFIRARHFRHGVALSHTKILLRNDQGQIYDIRVDNVFAAGYDHAPASVPAPLSALHRGERLSLCGRIYQTRSGRLGMDWVHTNCGNTPRPNAPNGWLALITPSMIVGPNLEDSQEYCHLW